MKADKLMDAITELDDEVLNEAAGTPSAEEIYAANKSGKRPLIFRFAATAALMALAVGSVIMFRKPAQKDPSPVDTGTAGIETQDVQPGTKAAGNETQDVQPADTLKEAQVLAEPVYPNEWSWEKEQSSGLGWSDRPYAARLAAGKETVDLYRGFFTDMMLLLLSDQNKESAVMSPVNIYMATAMLAEITDGQTRQEILDAFGVKDIYELRDQAAKIWGLCYKDDGREKTVLGNSLWLNNTLNYRSSTVQQLADSYYASAYIGTMGSDAYNSLLQKWINDMTGGLLENQVKDIELPMDTALALVSTIWHETKWGEEFSKEDTKPGIFRAPGGDIETDFMYSEWAAGSYFLADNYKFIFKGTRQGRVWLFLPDEGTSVQEMMQEESFRDFLSYQYNENDYFDYNYGDPQLKTTRGITGVYARVHLTVPKLDISYKQDLTDAIQKMGITTAFDPSKADYSPITDQPGVYLSKAAQGTRLIMDEEGVSAASYVEYLAGAALLEDEIDFVCDRPFFMMVTGYNEVPLFAGVVNVPQS